jgi:hypothetical protein
LKVVGLKRRAGELKASALLFIACPQILFVFPGPKCPKLASVTVYW